MKCVIPEISWNNRDPVLSLDIQPKIDSFVRLATSGTDTHIVIWYINNDENGAIQFEPVADLNKHQKAVNVVRWSPSGEFLASGDDESNIIVWKRRTDLDPPQLEPDSEEFKESWSIHKILRGHMDDVYDLSWSPDSTQIISGSVDNTAIVWNLTKTTKFILNPAHKGLVQGVAWDPLNKFYATLGSDRMCRVFDANTRRIISRSGKGALPFPESSPLHGQTVRLFHDDTLKSYFRRLTFSPDGNLLITPAGCVETEHCNRKIYMTYIYTRFNFKQPTLAIPSPDAFTVVVRCCPVLFTHRSDGPKPMIPLPYRIVIAIASQTSVQFYDTQQVQSFGAVTNIHYTRISDLSWSSDGLILAVSSTDGFCSFISFKPGELGDTYVEEEKKEVIKPEEIKKEVPKIIEKDSLIVNEDANDSWVQKTEPVEAMECDDVCDTQDMKLVLEETQTTDMKLVSEENQFAEIQSPPENIRLVLEDSIEENATKTPVLKYNVSLVEDQKIAEDQSVFSQTDFNVVKSKESITNPKTLTKKISEELMTDDLCSLDVEPEVKKNDSEILEKKEVPKSNSEENSKAGPKTPRRVNFVTLSSPRPKNQ